MRLQFRSWRSLLLLLPGVAAACGEPFSAGSAGPDAGGGGTGASSATGGQSAGGEGSGNNTSTPTGTTSVQPTGGGGTGGTGSGTEPSTCDESHWTVPPDLVVNEPFVVSYTDTVSYPFVRLLAAADGTQGVWYDWVTSSSNGPSYMWQFQLNLGIAADWYLQFVECGLDAGSSRLPNDGGIIDSGVEPICENVISGCHITVAAQ